MGGQTTGGRVIHADPTICHFPAAALFIDPGENDTYKSTLIIAKCYYIVPQLRIAALLG